MNPDTRLRRAPDVVATDMNGETVMMHIDKGTYFALTGSGSQVWAALEKPATLGEVIGFIEDRYDVSEEDDLAGVMAQFLGELVEQGLVDRVD